MHLFLHFISDLFKRHREANPGETVQSGSHGRQTFIVLKAIQFWDSSSVLALVSPPVEQGLHCLPISQQQVVLGNSYAKYQLWVRFLFLCLIFVW